MKKNLLLAVLLISSTAFAQTRVPVFVEKFNNGTTQRITPGASVAVADYQFFSNLDKGYAYSSTGVCDVRNVLNSTNYTYTLLDTARNPSAGENVFFNNIPGVSFTIKNIAIEAGVSELKIGHGVLKSSTLSNAAELKVEWQQQGADPAIWNNITMPLIIGGTGSNVWRFRESSLSIPAQPGLINIRFRQTSSSVQFRVDDIVMSFKAECVAPTITVVNNASTTFCNGQSITLKSAYLSATQYIWKRDGVEVQSSAVNTLVVTQAGNYTVIAKSSYCPVGGSPESAAKTITVNPTPVVQEITGADTYCTGAGGDLDVVATGGTNPLQFSWNNAAFTTQSSFTVPTTTAGNFTHTVIVKDVNNCQATANKAVVVNQSPGQPSVTASGPLSFCAGGSVTLTSSFATANQWYLNGEEITGSTNQTYIADTDGSYQVMHTAANGCGSTLSTAKVVNAISFDAPTVSFNAGNDTVCTEVLVTLASSSNSNNVWKVAGNTVSTAATYTIPTTTAGITTVTLFYTATEDAVSCPSGTASQDILINGRPTAPAVVFTGDATPCKGTTVSLSVIGAGGVYNWYKNADATPVFTGTTYEFTATDLGAANYSVTETDANTCESAQSAAQVIDVKDNPVVSITPSGATTFCQGTSVTLTAASSVGVTFAWDNDAMSTTPGIAVADHGTQDSTSTRIYTVTGTNSDVCTATAAQSVTINTKPVAAIAAAGGVEGTNQYEICANAAATLTGSATNTTGTLNYAWNSGTPATTSTFTAIVGNNTLVVSDANCASNQVSIFVNSNPVANPVITGTNEICTGGTTKNSTVLTVTEGVAAPTTYQWKLDAANASGTSTAKDYTANEGGSYSVVVTKTYTYSGGNLACAVTSAPYTVTAFPAPVVTITFPSGNPIESPNTLHFCQNQAPTLTANVAAGTPAFEYRWNGVTLLETFTAQNGDNKVIVVDAKGCTSVEVNQVAAENNTPVATITGRNEICASNANNTTDLTANSASADTYKWKKDGANAGGTDDQLIYTATTAGNYTVVVTQVHTFIACSSTSAIVAVSVKAIPTVTVSAPVSSFDDLACKQGTEIFIGLETTSTITAVPVSSTGATEFTYVWTGSNVSNGTTPIVTVAPTATENYTVTITEVVAGGLGCQSNVATQAIDVLDVNGQVAGFVAVCNGGEKNSSPEATGITTEVAAGQVRAYIQGAPSGACLGACDVTGLPIPPVDSIPVPPVDSIPVLPTDSLPDPLGGGLPTDSLVDDLPLPGALDSLLTDPIGTIGGLLGKNGVTAQNIPSVTKIAAYPNPFTESIALQIALSAESVVNVTITDMLGRVMYSVQQLALAAGEHTLPIDATKLSNGMYICTVQTATDAKVINLVKKD